MNSQDLKDTARLMVAGDKGPLAISVAAFLLSAKFWSTTLQTWQAECMIIAIYLVLSIFLRQHDSAESKPVEARDETTGEANK